MINFPILKHLSVTDFALYPGGEIGEPGLHIDFRQGLTLILGANGLGKTTLVNIVYRLLTGSYDIPGLASSTKLGNMALEAKSISRPERQTFANRVTDGAEKAKAVLTLQVGDNELIIERSLQNLVLTSFKINQVESDIEEVKGYQAAIQRLTGVSSFGDWVLLLRHLVFYFEDRRALVWDPSAQKEILRILFLSNDVSRKWLTDSRAILELDSRMRNLRSALNKEEAALSQTESQSETSVATLEQIRALEEVQTVQQAKLTQLQNEFVDVEATRQNLRLRLLTAEQEYENAYRGVERLKLEAITDSFPTMSDTMRFILSHLLTKDECLACGNQAPQAAASYLQRLDTQHCLVCDTPIEKRNATNANADGIFQNSLADLRKSEEQYSWMRKQAEEAEKEYHKYLSESAALDSEIAGRSKDLNKLVKNLPPEEGKLHEMRDKINEFQVLVESQTASIKKKKGEYSKFVETSSRTIQTQSLPITEAFGKYAEGFLLEECFLIWYPQKLKVGETGEMIDFPAFDLEMTGANFQTAVRRSGPDQVSESQREFIDLAFRMAMMEVAGATLGSSLFIDAPESSLDAVFVTRAANVLTRFATNPASNNRLVITSNLIEGQLIPHLIGNSTTGADIEQCVVNLFEIAAPTAAIRKLRTQYDAVFAGLLEEAAKVMRS